MAAPPSVPPLSKSRGHSLFDRQAQLHAHDPNNTSNATISDSRIPLPLLKSVYSMTSPPVSSSTSSGVHHHSPPLLHRRLPSLPTESYAHSNDNSVQLLSVHPRLESDYIKEVSSPPPAVSSKLLETDFPLYENYTPEESEEVTNETSIPNDSTSTSIVEQAFDYLPNHDDDDDVIHQEQECSSDSFDDENEDNSINTNYLDATRTVPNHQNDSKFSFYRFDLIKCFPQEISIISKFYFLLSSKLYIFLFLHSVCTSSIFYWRLFSLFSNILS
jgi:hypothetical protein